jgi:hypothetical protein
MQNSIINIFIKVVSRRVNMSYAAGLKCEIVLNNSNINLLFLKLRK